MSQVVTQTISVNDLVTETLSFASTTSNISIQSQPSYSYTNGTTSTAIDFHYEHTYTLASSASTTLTLSALTDDQGRTVAFVKVKKLSIYVTTKTGNDFLTVGAAASNPFTSILGGTTPTYIVRGYDLKVAQDTTGFAVTASASDQLKIVNSGSASMTFTVSISGTSA